MSRFLSFVDAVEAKLNDPTVKFVDGHPARTGQHGQRRRVHWYLVGGTVEPTEQAGGRTPTEGGTTREPSVHSRHEDIDVVVFAESVDNVDTLFDNLIVAIDRTAPNSGVEFSSYEFDYDQYSKRVPTIRFTITTKLPVVDEISPLTEITDEEHTCEYET